MIYFSLVVFSYTRFFAAMIVKGIFLKNQSSSIQITIDENAKVADLRTVVAVGL